MRLPACLALLALLAGTAHAEGLPAAPVWKIDPATRQPPPPEPPAPEGGEVTTSTDAVTTSEPDTALPGTARVVATDTPVQRVPRGTLPSRALATAVDGALILIAPGTYRDCLNVRASGVTVRPSAPGFVRFTAVACPNGATIQIGGDRVTLERIVVTGARNARHDGVAVRIDGRDTTLRRMSLDSSDQAIVTGPRAAGTLVIENSLVENSGTCAPVCRAAIAIGPVARLILRNTVLRRNTGGTHLQTAASDTLILQNSFTEAGGPDHASALISLRGRDHALILGNRFTLRETGSGLRCVTQAGLPAARFPAVRLDNNVVYNAGNGRAALLCATRDARATLVGNRLSGPVTLRAILSQAAIPQR